MEIETCWRYYRSFGIRGTRLVRISKLKHVRDTIVPQTFGERGENPPPNICGRVFFSNQRKPYPNIWGRFWR